MTKEQGFFFIALLSSIAVSMVWIAHMLGNIAAVLAVIADHVS